MAPHHGHAEFDISSNGTLAYAPGGPWGNDWRVVSVNRDGGKASVRALCDDRVVVTTGMVFAFKYIDDPLLEQKRAELMKVWMRPE